jgi:hypothetical protein
MLEQAACIACRNRFERPAQHPYECLAGASLGLAQHSLDLGEGLFDRIEVRSKRPAGIRARSLALRSTLSPHLPCER